MPLKPGKENIGSNIREMEASGHSHAQSVAAALHTANPTGSKELTGSTGGAGYQDVPGSGNLRLPELPKRQLVRRPKLESPVLKIT